MKYDKTKSAYADYPGYRLASVDASAIARANGLGTQSVPIVNTALAGAMGRILGFELEQVTAHTCACKNGFPPFNFTRGCWYQP